MADQLPASNAAPAARPVTKRRRTTADPTSRGVPTATTRRTRDRPVEEPLAVTQAKLLRACVLDELDREEETLTSIADMVASELSRLMLEQGRLRHADQLWATLGIDDPLWTDPTVVRFAEAHAARERDAKVRPSSASLPSTSSSPVGGQPAASQPAAPQPAAPQQPLEAAAPPLPPPESVGGLDDLDSLFMSLNDDGFGDNFLDELSNEFFGASGGTADAFAFLRDDHEAGSANPWSMLAPPPQRPLDAGSAPRGAGAPLTFDITGSGSARPS
ncbi:hypothetical protein H9P43_002740 [Blastocladiella emersonii ATCC 22665]|nr:hypothetical protein H9P43_002740 [Blastocladiella emersonii ATCC 22665]